MESERDWFVAELVDQQKYAGEMAARARKPDCPPLTDLLKVASDQAAPNVQASVQSHVSGCRPCQLSLEAFRRARESETLHQLVEFPSVAGPDPPLGRNGHPSDRSLP